MIKINTHNPIIAREDRDRVLAHLQHLKEIDHSISIADQSLYNYADQWGVFHICSYGMSGREQIKNKRKIYQVNVIGTEFVIFLCKYLGIEALVYTSTTNVVFNGSMKFEGRDDRVEKTIYPDLYIDPYSHSKSLAERLVLSANFDYTLFYPSDHQNHHVIHNNSEKNCNSYVKNQSQRSSKNNDLQTLQTNLNNLQNEVLKTNVQNKNSTKIPRKYEENEEKDGEEAKAMDRAKYCTTAYPLHLIAPSSINIDNSLPLPFLYHFADQPFADQQMANQRQKTKANELINQSVCSLHCDQFDQSDWSDSHDSINEQPIKMHHKGTNQRRVNTCSIRPAGIYGEEEERHLPRIVEAIRNHVFSFTIGVPESRVEFVHVDHLIAAHVRAIERLMDLPYLSFHQSPLFEQRFFVRNLERMERWKIANQSYFISDGDPVNNFEFFRPIVEFCGHPFPKFRVSFGAMYHIAFLIESIFVIFWRYFGVDFFQPLTRAEICKVAQTHYWPILKSEEDLGYIPQIRNSAIGMQRLIDFYTLHPPPFLSTPPLFPSFLFSRRNLMWEDFL